MDYICGFLVIVDLLLGKRHLINVQCSVFYSYSTNLDGKRLIYSVQKKLSFLIFGLNFPKTSLQTVGLPGRFSKF